MPSPQQDLGEYFAQEEARLLAKAKADIAREQADPEFQRKVLAQQAKRDAEVSDEQDEVAAEDDDEEDDA